MPDAAGASRAEPLGAWRRLDAAVYRAERFVVLWATIIMTAAVFVAVVWRLFAAPEGKFEGFIIAITGDDSRAVRLAARGMTAAAWAWLCVFGVRTARRQWSLARQVAVGLTCAAAAVAAGKITVWALPSGLVFSQRLALCLMMWTVLLGCSMAAHSRRHILLQAMQKLVPTRLLPAHAALGSLLAAAFTLFLVFVCGRYSLRDFGRWWESDFTGAVFESAPIPYWTVTIAVPLGFGLTAIRFVAEAIGIWRGDLPPLAASHDVAPPTAADRGGEP